MDVDVQVISHTQKERIGGRMRRIKHLGVP